MKVIIGSDHGGVELKAEIIKFLEAKNIEVINLGVNDHDSVDYPDKATEVCEQVLASNGEACGILICGTGIGISIAANKIKGIRAALCSNEFSARKAREHNDANVITLGGRVTGPELACSIVEAYLTAEHESGGRHDRRIEKITNLEQTT